MELRDVMLFLHIVGAGTWLGANMVQMVAPRMAFSYGTATAAGWMRMGGDLGLKLYMPAGLVVLATGIVLVLISDVYTFGHRFVIVGVIVVIVGAVLGPTVFGPGAAKAAEAIEADDQSAIVATTSRLARFGAFDTLLVLTAIAVMIIRWN